MQPTPLVTLVGVALALTWAIPIALAIVLGAVVAPPDTAAATSLGKRIGLPPRIEHAHNLAVQMPPGSSRKIRVPTA